MKLIKIFIAMKNPHNRINEKERRLVTILFADLSGFTAFSENLDPEELSDSINICFEILNRIITDHGGTIHKYEGDSVLAIFGLPHAHEDDPERGIKAALEMMERFPEINKALGDKLGTHCDLGLHVGINLGTVFAGAIGSREKKEYTIIGEAVNMASRLMNAAKFGEILVSGRVFRQTRYLFEYEPLEPIMVKGISKRVHIYRPVKLKEKPEPKRGIEGLRSSLVGRDEEFKILSKKIHLLSEKKESSVVFVLGDAGIGKSRLFEELKSYISTQNISITVLEGRCLSYGESMTYFPILEILKQFFGIADPESIDVIGKKITQRCQKLLPETYQEVVPYIYYLFSIPLTPEYIDKVKHLDAEGLNLQISMALKELLKVSSEKSPLLLVIEDYHWIDSASLGLIRFFYDTPHAMPLIVMCLSRVEKESEGYHTKEHLRLQLGDNFTEIYLRALPLELSQQLVDNLLARSGLPPDVKSEILHKAEGNPLYLEEMLRSLIDRGFLIKESDVWKASEQLTVSGIPDSIQELIVARLDQLEPALKELLQKAAVIGRSFLIPLLERLTRVNSLMISVHLATLEEFGYIRLLSKEPELEYIFKHPLVQEVAYDSLPKKYRRELHRKVAEIIEETFSQRLEEFTELLAHHYLRSDASDKAMVWLMKAGRHAQDRYAHDESIKYFEDVIKKARSVKDLSDDLKELQREAHEALGDVCAIRGTYEAAIKEYEEMYEQSSDVIMQAAAMLKKARVFFHQSNYDKALKHIDDALTMLKGDSRGVFLEQADVYLLRGTVHSVKGLTNAALEDLTKVLDLTRYSESSDRGKKIKASGLIHLGGIHRSSGRYDKAIDVYKQSEVILQELDDKQNLANVMYMLGVVYHKKGDSQKAIDLNERGLALLEEIGDKKGISTACMHLGIMYYYSGQHDKALKLHQKGLQISMEIGSKRGMGMAYSNIAIAYLYDNEYDKAHEYFQKYLQISEEIGDRVGISAALGNLAILYIKTKEYDKAEDYLLQTEKTLAELGNKELLLTAYVHLADVKRLRKQPLENALSYIDKAWQLARDIDTKPGKADCHFAYAKIYGVMKDIIKAEEHLLKAERYYMDIGRINALYVAYHDFAQILNDIGENELASKYAQKAKEIKPSE